MRVIVLPPLNEDRDGLSSEAVCADNDNFALGYQEAISSNFRHDMHYVLEN